MICGNCGAENRADRRFCLQCGTPLAQGCPNCGATNEPVARFCGNCGHALGTAPPASTAARRAEQPHQQQPAPPGTAERRLVTVLFADLVGFTPFAEERDSEEVRDTLERYFALAREVIERYGGTIEKFIGDAVMAVWGTPTAHEDDAERAVRAALDLVDVVQTLGHGIQARAGVLTGEAAVNRAATDQALLAGDIVNTAARLQSVAPAGAVLVGESTMRVASAALAFEPAGEQTLKGKQSPVPAWRALRVVAQRRGAGRSDMLETPFVGRQEEFRQLRELLHLGGRDPRPRLVSVTGPAGIGKSRLAWELEKYVDGVVERIPWHRGRCPAYGEGITFWALGEMVRSRSGLSETDDAATTRQRLSETVDEYVADESERPWIVSALLALLGLEPPPQGGREMLFAAWRRFFECIAERGTTVLVFEDLHWADSGLLDFIDYLLDWSKNAPLLVITLARPELFDRRPDWGAGRRTYTAMALDPLSDDEMRELLAALVPDLEQDAVQTIVSRADGIPLYAVEMVRMLMADGRLVDVDGIVRPTRELGALAIPDSLRSLITARLDDLDARDKGLLQNASVLGQSFTVDALAEVAGITRDELEPRLRQLVRRELLVLDADPRSPERGHYAFMQSLTREVAYSTLARAERRTRHLAAARHFESVGGDEIAGVLAGHYLAAHGASAPGAESEAVATQARLALRGAAERASTLGSHEQAAAYLEQAISVTDEPAEKAELLERQGHEAGLAGRYERAEAAARAAIELYDGLGDITGAARTRGILGTILVHDLRAREAIAELELTVEQLPEDAEPAVRADALAKLARAYYRNLEPDRSIDTAGQALALAEHHGLLVTAADAMVSKGTALNMLNRNLEALALLLGGVDLARREGDIPTALRGMANATSIVGQLHGADEAITLNRQALELARTAGDTYAAAWQLGNLAVGAVYVGLPLDPLLAEIDEMLGIGLDEVDQHTLRGRYFWVAMFRGLNVDAQFEEWAQQAELRGDPQAPADIEFARGLRSVIGGDYTSASRHFERSARHQPAGGPYAEAALFAALADDPEDAERLLEEAQRSGLSSRSEKAIRGATRAVLAAAAGRHDEALAGFAEALRTLRAIGSRLEVGWVALAMLRALGADEPAARQAGEEALAAFEAMGAEPMVAQLRQALAGGMQPATAAETRQAEAAKPVA